tara:strand:- start:221 stop:523 length:303 start_codon:yes stop_codon:yes gene_type:complete
MDNHIKIYILSFLAALLTSCATYEKPKEKWDILPVGSSVAPNGVFMPMYEVRIKNDGDGERICVTSSLEAAANYLNRYKIPDLLFIYNISKGRRENIPLR